MTVSITIDGITVWSATTTLPELMGENGLCLDDNTIIEILLLIPSLHDDIVALLKLLVATGCEPHGLFSLCLYFDPCDGYSSGDPSCGCFTLDFQVGPRHSLLLICVPVGVAALSRALAKCLGGPRADRPAAAVLERLLRAEGGRLPRLRWKRDADHRALGRQAHEHVRWPLIAATFMASSVDEYIVFQHSMLIQHVLSTPQGYCYTRPGACGMGVTVAEVPARLTREVVPYTRVILYIRGCTMEESVHWWRQTSLFLSLSCKSYPPLR